MSDTEFTTKMQEKWETQLATYYQKEAKLKLPRNPEQRTWYVKSALTGNDVRIEADNKKELWKKILEQQPLRIRYSATERKNSNHFFEVPMYFEDKDAARQATLHLKQDFNLKDKDIHYIKDGHRYYQLVITGGSFKDADRSLVKRLLNYFLPDQFIAPMGRPQTKLQVKYWDYIKNRLDTWNTMNPVQLEEHLKAKTPLGGEAATITNFFKNTHNPAMHIDQHTKLHEFLHQEALEYVFTKPNKDKTLHGPKISLPGSYDGLTDRIVELHQGGVQ